MSHVLITGGSSGIGAACVEKFCEAGHEVSFTYRSGKDAAAALIDSWTARGKKIRAFPFDQGEHASLLALMESLSGCSPVEVLVANAGLGSATVKKVASEPHLQDQALMQVNATGTLWLVQALVEKMSARGQGKIILVSSVGGGINVFPAFRLADGMSKAAVAFLGKQLAAEQARTGIDVFTVCPGATETAMFEASTLAHLNAEERKAFIDRLPKKRLIDPRELAELILYLTRDEARVLHGAVLDASLGLGVHPGLVTGSGS